MTTFTLYDVAVPAFEKGLTGLAWVLCKADEQYRAEGRDAARLIGDQLAPDMFPLGLQLALAIAHSADALDKFKGAESRPVRPLATLEEAREAVSGALARIRAIRPEDLEGAEARRFVFDPRGTGGFPFDGSRAYLLDFATPNFWFHVTTAYAILRKNGAPIGKRDFLAAGEPPPGLAA